MILHSVIKLCKMDKMKNICLIKVTVVVITMALASSLVSAKGVIPKASPTITAPTSSNTKFEQLDLDRSLSLVETQRFQMIHDAFTQIDSNNDATISKVEFNDFKIK